MARDFNGTSDRIDWASVATMTGSPITISVWVYSDGLAGNPDYMLCLHNTGDTAIRTVFSVAGNTGINFYKNGDTTLNVIGVVPNSWAGWLHFLVTHDGTMTDATTVHIYRSGTEVGSYSTQQNGANEYASSGSWSIGGRIFDDNRNFDGRIGEMAVWNRVLSAAEITQLAAGYYPGYFSTNLLFYWSGDNNSLVANPGGTGTADGTTDYTTNYPAITYPATLNGRATITATGQVNGAAHSAASTLTGRATIIATGTVSGGTAHSAVATLNGRATITATGRRGVNATATISGRATLTATPYVLIDDIILEWTDVSATIQGRATLSGTGTNIVNASSSLSGRATIIATGQVINNAAGTISGRASIIATGQVGRQVQATIQGRATIIATGTIVGQVNGSAVIAASAAITATAQVGREAQAALIGQANLTATGLVTANGQATLIGQASVTATGSVAVNGQAIITGSVIIIATGTTSAGGTSHSVAAALAGYAYVTATGQVSVYAQAVITASANLTGIPPTRGTGERTVLYFEERDTLYMPTREDVIIDG